MKSTDRRTILFTCCTGAAGNIGGHTLDAFARRTQDHPDDYVIRIGARSPARAQQKFSTLISDRKFVEVVKLDLSDPKTYEAAVHGVDAVFLGQPDSGGMDTKELIEQFVQVAANAQPAAPFVVRLVAGASLPETKAAFDKVGCPLFAPHFDAYQKFGEARADGTLDVTFVDACTWFFQNYTNMYAPLVKAGVLAIPNGNAKLPYMDSRDIGDFAACILLSPDKYKNKDMALTGAFKLATSDWADIISSECGLELSVSTDETALRSEFEKIPIDEGVTFWTFMKQFYEVERLIGEADAPLRPDLFTEVTGRKHSSPRSFCKEMINVQEELV